QAESVVAWLNAPKKPSSIQAFRHVAGWYYAAPYGVYATKDGHLALSLSPLEAIAEAIGEPRIAGFSLADTWKKQDEIGELIAQRLKTAATQEWTARMEPLEIWHAPVQGYAEIADDPQVQHMRSMLRVAGMGGRQEQVTLLNHPALYDGEAAQV